MRNWSFSGISLISDSYKFDFWIFFVWNVTFPVSGEVSSSGATSLGVNFGWHFLFFEYVFRNLNPKPSDPIRRYNATFLQLQALYSATHDCCACSVVGVFVVSMSCGPELNCHGAALRPHARTPKCIDFCSCTSDTLILMRLIEFLQNWGWLL